MGTALLPIAIIGSALAGAGTSMYSASQQRKSAQEAQEKQEEAYEKQQKAMDEAAVFPTKGEVTNIEKTYTGKLGQQRLGSYQSLASELASRGFGAGGGYGEGRAGEIEKGYAGGLSDLYRNLISFANTPKYTKGVAGVPDYSAYVTQSPGAAGASSISDMMGTAAGYMMMSKMLQGKG